MIVDPIGHVPPHESIGSRERMTCWSIALVNVSGKNWERGHGHESFQGWLGHGRGRSRKEALAILLCGERAGPLGRVFQVFGLVELARAPGDVCVLGAFWWLWPSAFFLGHFPLLISCLCFASHAVRFCSGTPSVQGVNATRSQEKSG